jgi:uncharacterized protein (TIGR03000 family)
MNSFPFKLPVFVAATMLLAIPVNQAFAQKGGRGGGGGGHVSGGHVSGGGVRVGGASIAGVRPGGAGVHIGNASMSRPITGTTHWSNAGHIIRPGVPNHNPGFDHNHNRNNVVFFGFGGGGWWGPGPLFYDGFYGGYGAAPYTGGYFSAYPPGDVFSTPIPGGEPPPMESAPTPQTMTALVVVMVPTDNAELWFNGVKTQTQGQRREFVTPELPPGQTFNYEIKARWTADGKDIERTRTVRVQAGAQSVVNFLIEDREQLPAPGNVQQQPPIKLE